MPFSENQDRRTESVGIVPGVINLDLLVLLVSVCFLHHYVTTFPFVISKY